MSATPVIDILFLLDSASLETIIATWHWQNIQVHVTSTHNIVERNSTVNSCFIDDN